MLLTGAEIIIECLKEQGVDTIFGYPGGAIMEVYDALYKHSDEITHYLTSHEQGAAHAADGYARATGKVGVCFATSGPGATNLVTGIATAQIDSVPIVAITCNVARSLLGKDSFQEIDISGITMPVTKHNFIIKEIEELAPSIRRAFKIARSGRPGVVLVDVTKDVTQTKTEYTCQKPEPCTRAPRKPDLSQLDEVVSLIEHSEKPFILAGGGVIASGAAGELRNLARKIQAPVADTLMGKGAFSGTDDYYTGMVGMHGTKTSNYGITESDLLIAVGARFSDRVLGNVKEFARHADLVHIDIDIAEIDKNIVSNYQLIGDAKDILQQLCDKVSPADHTQWLRHIREMKTHYPLTYDHDVLSGPGIIEDIYEATNGDALICTEVGQHQMWAAQFYKYREPRQFFTSGGLGTMGYGLGASMGIKVGRPEKVVVNIAGDGCFRMNMNELATASRYNIPIIEVIINNHALGMVHQWQAFFYGGRYSFSEFHDKTDYVKVSEAMGVPARRVKTPQEFHEAFQWALAMDGPALLDCVIDTNEMVWPMVAPGASIADCVTKEDVDF